MSQIPWSAERERQLRQRILLLHSSIWLTFMLTLAFFFSGIFTHHRFLLLGSLVFVMVIFLVPKLADATNQLGQEERILSGARAPGFGMLANKPRETSRLTKWRHWKESEGLGPLGFTCENCLRPHDWSDMQWIPNVAEDEEEPGTATVDPEGGRYVLICPCGTGHYILKEKQSK
jgi:hypothetical protein